MNLNRLRNKGSEGALPRKLRKNRDTQAKPPAQPWQVLCLQWWGRRFRLPRPVLLALLLVPAAQAQFNLFVVQGSTETAAPAVYDFDSLYADETGSALFRLRNTSNAPAAVDVLAVAGVGFTLTAPALPVGLAPQSSIDFTVAFHATGTGAYSASLHSDGIAILLTATVAPRLT